MARKLILSALVAAAVVAACDSGVPSASPAANLGQATVSPSAVALASSSPTASPTPTATPTSTPTPTATPTTTPAPTPPPWKSYRSKRFHYKIQYPPTWVVTPGTSKLADQIDDFSDHFVYLSRDTVSTFVSISLTVSHDIATFKSHYKAKLLSNTSLSLQGYSGRILIFSGKENGRNVLIQHVILGKGKIGYFIDMFTGREQIAADKALFKRIYKTWRPTA